MSAVVINLVQVRAEKNAKISRLNSDKIHETTIQFARLLNNSVETHKIDPVHQATLLMAKAIDVLAEASPVSNLIEDQHARSENLLKSVFRARQELHNKSVWMFNAPSTGQNYREQDGFTV